MLEWRAQKIEEILQDRVFVLNITMSGGPKNNTALSHFNCLTCNIEKQDKFELIYGFLTLQINFSVYFGNNFYFIYSFLKSIENKVKESIRE
jgi:hypothetical protein